VKRPDVVVAGAGLFGLVCAERITSLLPGSQATVLESTDCLGGLCATATDPLTGVTYHPYGTHVLATGDARVWRYVTHRTRMISYRHKVWASIDTELVPLPLGLEAIRVCYRRPSLTPDEARRLVERDAAPHRTGRVPANAEEAALAAVGPRLYETFVHGHITKQWGAGPAQLAPGVFSDRFGIRYTPTAGYRSSARWQGLPAGGWGELFRRLADHPGITVRHNTPAAADALPPFPHACLVTTPIDDWFGHDMGTLERGRISVDWRLVARRHAPSVAAATYPDQAIPHYRTHTPVHLPGQHVTVRDKVLVGFEHHGDGQYPIDFVLRTPANQALADAYKARASRTGYVHFAGRGTTFHDDMGATISAALDLAAQLAQITERSPAWPRT
jgi:UDP-galactopyranose mutase